jgi:hypothetical protein
MEQYWIIILAISLVLFVVAIREAVVAYRLPPVAQHRGLYWFNSVALLLLIMGILYGGRYFDHQRDILMAEVMPYPAARYAPERGVLEGSDTWVFLTRDRWDQVVEYYEGIPGYRVTKDDGGTMRILVEVFSRRIFITGVTEGSTLVLYYSRKGEVHHIEIPEGGTIPTVSIASATPMLPEPKR